MSFFDFKKPAIKLKVQVGPASGTDNDEQLPCKQFSIDPKVISFEVLRRMIARSFDIKCDFNLSYLSLSADGSPRYYPILSDWDLDAALISASTDSVLQFKVDMREYEAGLEEWDIIVPADVPSFQRARSTPGTATSRTTLKHSFSLFSQLSEQVEKTVNSMQKAIEEAIPVVKQLDQTWKATKSPMTVGEMQNFIDNQGRLTNSAEFRRAVYLGGMKPATRKFGWRLLLRVCPDSFTTEERETFLARQSRRYYAMKRTWKEAYACGRLTTKQVNLIAGISVDVVRTDQCHSFFAATENACTTKSKVSQLFDLLVTYSLYHPSVGYCQGMSDLASPLLLTQCGDEDVAYVCFCALMNRMKSNFASDGEALVTKLQHLHDMLVYYDPILATHLRDCGLANMFFAHRWLLVELKREFRLEESLRFLEVQWAALPGSGAGRLFPQMETPFSCLVEEHLLVNKEHTSNVPHNIELEDDERVHSIWNRITQLTSVTHPQSSSTPSSVPVENGCKSQHVTGAPHSSVNTNSPSRLNPASSFIVSHCYAGHDLDLLNSLVGKEYQVVGDGQQAPESQSSPCPPESSDCSPVIHPQPDVVTTLGTSHSDSSTSSTISSTVSSSSNSSCPDVVHPSPPAEIFQGENQNVSSPSNVCKTYGLIVLKDGVVELPAPMDLGYGNPFLQFLCLALLMEYRESILRNVREVFDLLQLLQRVHQKHPASRVLARAREMYDAYLQDQNTRRKRMDDFPELEVSL